MNRTSYSIVVSKEDWFQMLLKRLVLPLASFTLATLLMASPASAAANPCTHGHSASTNILTTTTYDFIADGATFYLGSRLVHRHYTKWWRYNIISGIEWTEYVWLDCAGSAR
jgi:hypothetical protein